ncbi:uncharacterized protein LOC113210828 [Frankliniella occidentalis]|uniref:Uncharacterized protein LOC113210828 n=1 Tax=Frankliniella occidentalis TaxID=133901 RepID=A0A9C6X2Y7_FRAOC|nr:uncharacterized protein LOC113210828 [Frankliniella occidentalis]
MFQGANKLLPEGMCIGMSQLSIVTSDGVVSYMTAASADSALPEANEVASALPQTSHGCGEVNFKESRIVTSEATISQDDPSNLELHSAKIKRGRITRRHATSADRRRILKMYIRDKALQ